MLCLTSKWAGIARTPQSCLPPHHSHCRLTWSVTFARWNGPPSWCKWCQSRSCPLWHHVKWCCFLCRSMSPICVLAIQAVFCSGTLMTYTSWLASKQNSKFQGGSDTTYHQPRGYLITLSPCMYACCRPVLCIDHVPALEATSSLAYPSPPCSYPSLSVMECPSQSSVRPLAWYVPQSSHYMCPYLVFTQFAASIPLLMYSLLGTSHQLNMAPEAALSLLSGQAATEFCRLYPELDPDYIGATVATAIGLQVCPHYLEYHRKSQQVHRFASFLGFLDVVLSHALLQGFVAAVAVVIAVCMVTSSFVYLTSHSPSEQFILSLKQLWTRLFFSYKTYGHMHINSPPSSALVLCWHWCFFIPPKTASDQWRPVTDNSDVEDIPGVLIVQIRESLDFGVCCHKIVCSTLTVFISQHLSAQRQVQWMHLASMLLMLFFCTAVHLWRFELYGAKPAHPSDVPLRQDTQVFVFHMADVKMCDASCVSSTRTPLLSPTDPHV